MIEKVAFCMFDAPIGEFMLIDRANTATKANSQLSPNLCSLSLIAHILFLGVTGRPEIYMFPSADSLLTFSQSWNVEIKFWTNLFSVFWGRIPSHWNWYPIFELNIHYCTNWAIGGPIDSKCRLQNENSRISDYMMSPCGPNAVSSLLDPVTVCDLLCSLPGCVGRLIFHKFPF